MTDITAPAGDVRGGLPDFFQHAHVTTSLDRAMADFGARLGLTEYLQMRDHSVITKGGERAYMHVALAWLGDLMIELIEPIGGNDLVYRAPLIGLDYGVRHHHMARIFQTDAAFDRAMADLSDAGIDFPIVATLEDTKGKCRVNYADLRAELGYYVENMVFSPSGLEWLQTIPRN